MNNFVFDIADKAGIFLLEKRLLLLKNAKSNWEQKLTNYQGFFKVCWTFILLIGTEKETEVTVFL